MDVFSVFSDLAVFSIFSAFSAAAASAGAGDASESRPEKDDGFDVDTVVRTLRVSLPPSYPRCWDAVTLPTREPKSLCSRLAASACGRT